MLRWDPGVPAVCLVSSDLWDVPLNKGGPCGCLRIMLMMFVPDASDSYLPATGEGSVKHAGHVKEAYPRCVVALLPPWCRALLDWSCILMQP